MLNDAAIWHIAMPVKGAVHRITTGLITQALAVAAGPAVASADINGFVEAQRVDQAAGELT